MSFLGVDGYYKILNEDAGFSKSSDYRGTHVEYNAFIEVSLLRLFYGKYIDKNIYKWQGADYELNENGYVAGLKLQF